MKLYSGFGGIRSDLPLASLQAVKSYSGFGSGKKLAERNVGELPAYLKRCRDYSSYMKKEHVADRVVTILRSAGWEHSHLPRSCFDLLGRGETQSVLFKLLSNVDSATRESAEEMKKAAMYLSASPLLVGERNSRGELEKQVVYERYGIPTVKPETLESYLNLREQSVVMNKKGGYYVSLDADRIEERRKEKGYSLNALAKEVGVSRRTIVNYEKDGAATPEKAQRLEEVLGDVVQGIDLFSADVTVEHRHPDDRTAERLVSIGFTASGFRRAPFDVAAKDENDRFIAQKAQEEPKSSQLEALITIQNLSSSTPFLITRQRKEYSGVASVTEKTLRNVESRDALKRELI